MLENSQEYRIMAQVESEHWWYQSLHSLVLKKISQLSKINPSILDAGCGTGGLICYLKQHGYSQIKGFDLSEHAVNFCAAVDLDIQLSSLQNIETCYPHEKFDVIVSNDTLCYLESHEIIAFFEQSYQRLNHGGLLLCNLPAFDLFSGIHDKSVGINKRFTLKEINRYIEATPFELTDYLFWPFLLSPFIFLVRLGQKLKLKLVKKPIIRSDLSVLPNWLNHALITLCRLENHLIPHRPFASSLFITLKKS